MVLPRKFYGNAKRLALILLFLIFMAVPVKALPPCDCNSCKVGCTCPAVCPSQANAACSPAYSCGAYTPPYQKGTSTQCALYSGTTPCGAMNYFCGNSYYYTGSTSCTTSNPAYCTAASRTASCNSNTVCGMCASGADTCGTATCGLTYGCASPKVCNGVGTGAGNCVSLVANEGTCYCNAMCTSGYCNSSSKCTAPFYTNKVNKCGFTYGAEASCGGTVTTTYCTSGNYYPTQACSSSPTNTACIAESAATSCAVCGDCAGGADTCNAVTCGTTNSYGCGSGSYCNGAKGAGSCNAPFGTGAACNCSAQCTSGVCTGNVCQAKYQSGTNLCGYYTGTSSSCGSANTYCSAGTYYPTQTCSATPTYTACQTADTTHYCLVCGNCAGGADTCGTATCGTIYGCAGGNVCNGQGTGAGNCVALGGTGATCYCNAMCTSGVCTGNVCQAKYQSGTNLCGYYTGTSSSCGSATNYCTAGNYYPTQACSATPTYTSCQAITSSASCAVCGDCAGGADTCNAVTCGTTNSYGCGSGSYCNGAKGAGSCNSPFATGHACNCSAQCSSPDTCISNVCTAPAGGAINVSATSYSNCGAVFYKVSLYDQNSKLVDSSFTIKFINPSLVTVLTQAGYPNNATGVYASSFLLNVSSAAGTWLLKVTASSGVIAGKNFYVVPSP